MKYKNLQENIEKINLDDLSDNDVLNIETTIKEWRPEVLYMVTNYN